MDRDKDEYDMHRQNKEKNLRRCNSPEYAHEGDENVSSSAGELREY